MEFTFENKDHFNMRKQLTKKPLFLSYVDQYIDDAHEQGNKQAKLSLHVLKAVQQRYTSVMKDFLVLEASAS
jgi:hypothetical protein